MAQKKCENCVYNILHEKINRKKQVWILENELLWFKIEEKDLTTRNM